MGRGKCRTARHHGTRQHRELRGTMGRGNTENCAAAWNAGTGGTARHLGTRQDIELRPFGRTRGTMGERRHTGARHYGARQYESARHHRRAATETRGSIHERGTTDERQHTSARQHYEIAAARVRGTTYVRPHSCAAAYMNPAP